MTRLTCAAVAIATILQTVSVQAAAPPAGSGFSPAPPGASWAKLKSAAGDFCCSGADGADVYWDKNPDDPSQYRAFIVGQYVPVPPSAIVPDQNWNGTAVIWLDNKRYDASGALVSFRVRCFWPAAAY